MHISYFKDKMIYRKIKNYIKSIPRRFYGYTLYKAYKRQYKEYLKKNGYPDKSREGEDLYIKQWSFFSAAIEPYSYRFFCNFTKFKESIIPEDIAHTYIEYYLNPPQYRKFYSDKNFYSQYLSPPTAFPETLICRVNGGELLDASFNKSLVSFSSNEKDIKNYLSDCDSVILKPTVDTKGGFGIKLFDKREKCFTDKEGSVLNGSFLESYGNDFVIQKAIKQHPYIAKFNESSVNTMRLCLYRSISTEDVIIFAAALRIGTKGSFLDNTHSGGCIVKIDIGTGQLGKHVFGKYRKRFDEWNGIDFSKNDFQIPNWNDIKELAVRIAKQNHHMRLIAIDIALQENGIPCMIEYNVDDFSFGLPLCLGEKPFGDYYLEVVNYCKNRVEEERKLNLI